MTSLPPAFNLLASASTSKAASVVRLAAKELRETEAARGGILLRGGGKSRRAGLYGSVPQARPSEKKPDHCFAAIVWARGRITAGITWLSTRSCKILLWLR